MTEAIQDGIPRTKDFSGSDEDSFFTVRGIQFDIRDDIPIRNFRAIGRGFNGLEKLSPDEKDDDAYVAVFKDLFAGLLEADSVDAVNQALDPLVHDHLVNADGRRVVIGLKKAKDILLWILEVQGLRPTQPSSNSSE